MARLLLALLVAFHLAGPAVFGETGGELPVNVLTQPDAVSAADRDLLKNAGYTMDDGTIRLHDQPPLTAPQLAEVLSRLKVRGRREAAGEPARREKFQSPRARLVMERLVRAWDKTTGQELIVSVSLYSDGLRVPPPAMKRAARSGSVAGAGEAASVRAASGRQLRDAAAQLPASTLVPREAGPLEGPGGGYIAGDIASPVQQTVVPAPMEGAPKPDAAPVVPAAPKTSQPAVPLPDASAKPANPKAPAGRVASLFLSDDLIAQIINDRIKDSEIIKDLSIEFDPVEQEIHNKGLLKLPADSLRTLNLDEKAVPDFRFELTIHFKTTKEGYLMLEFPLDDTFFYPANSKDPTKDRVVVPVQLLEMVLAAARGYLGVLSGDTSGFDKKAAGVQAGIKALDKLIAGAKDPDEKAALSDRRALLALQLQSIPIEKRQAERLGKQFSGVLGLVGKQESLDQALEASRNSIVLKIRLDQLVPYFKGIQLGGIRIVEDTKDGEGERFVAIDLVTEAP